MQFHVKLIIRETFDKSISFKFVNDNENLISLFCILLYIFNLISYYNIIDSRKQLSVLLILRFRVIKPNKEKFKCHIQIFLGIFYLSHNFSISKAYDVILACVVCSNTNCAFIHKDI